MNAPRRRRRAKGKAAPPAGDGRTAAILALRAMLVDGARLDEALDAESAPLAERRERALARELATGITRWQLRLDALIDPLLARPLGDPALRIALRLGIYQLEYTRIPPHAAVSSAVDAARVLGLGRASGLVNGVLRGYQRRRDELLADAPEATAAKRACPAWLAATLEAAWPEEHESILEAQVSRAPLTLRVNTTRSSREALADRLGDEGLTTHPGRHALTALHVEGAGDPGALPGLAEGHFVVQDEASQLVANIVAPRTGERVLDACAAPGGKAGALLQAAPGIELVALDVDEARLAQVRETLARLGLDAQCHAADARATPTWWDRRPFDAIILDAPCTATGIIRRHPDIPHRRRAGDDARLAEDQLALLEGVWPMLKSGGRLVYSTCSILPNENAALVDRFLALQDDARGEPIEATWGRPSGVGRQILPGEDAMDGFFYARLVRD